MPDDWPVDLQGVTETVVATKGINERWNLAALGVFAPDHRGEDRVRARTWGKTRTRRNFERTGSGIVQFTRDPVDFVRAALTIEETDGPMLASADAWVSVEVRPIDRGTEGTTEWVEWALEPTDHEIQRRVVPTTNRGTNAVIEATVVASRLDVDRYDPENLTNQLSYLESVVDACGGERARRAMDIVEDEISH